MTQHTPGPWSTADTTNGVVAAGGPLMVDIVSSETGSAIASCVGCGDTHEIDEANAKLIAAAPDLLDALRDARSGMTLDQHTCSLIEKIDAAISKATL